MFSRGWILPAALAASQALAQAPLTLADGEIVLGWVSSSSFHFCRSWGGDKCAPRVPAVRDDIEADRTETSSQVRFSTEHLMVEIDKQDGRLRVLNRRNEELMAETAAAARTGSEIRVERVARPGEAFYGLGARADAEADARGKTIESGRPFLFSSSGYGLYHGGPGVFRFDLASTTPDRYTVVARPALRFEYYFYYGPALKAVLEEHMRVVEPRGRLAFGILSPADLPEGSVVVSSPAGASWESLAAAVRSLVHASLSAIPSPAFDLGPFRRAPAALYRRATQLASVAPLVCDTASGPVVGDMAKARYGLLEMRRRLAPFLTAYVDEVEYRGYPVWHPLPFQYPNDKEAGRLADQFLVGDELLAAPVFTESNRRSVYFPMGNWTDLRTNRVYAGRQRVEIEAPPDAIPLFLRNGSILPLESEEPGGPMELHYTPRLAAEFFLYEPGISQYSQLHAAPALDVIRLEIDSRKTRAYEWIVHHLPPPREVRTGETVHIEAKERRSLRPEAWYYDRERGNLHIVVQAFAGEVRVTHIAF